MTSEYDELVRQLQDDKFAPEDSITARLEMKAADAITRLTREKAEARAQGAEEMREKAAKVAESHGFIQARDTDWDGGVNFARKFIAAAIRSLPKPVGE